MDMNDISIGPEKYKLGQEWKHATS